MDLASFELVENSKETLFKLLHRNLVDIIICNEEEAIALAKVIILDIESSIHTRFS